MAVQHVEDEKPAEAVADEAGLPGAKARERLDIRIMRSAPMVGKDVHFVPEPLQPAREKRHRRGGHPKPGNQDHMARRHPRLPSRAKIALARTMGFSPATR
jgi:hypothetical protein